MAVPRSSIQPGYGLRTAPAPSMSRMHLHPEKREPTGYSCRSTDVRLILRSSSISWMSTIVGVSGYFAARVSIRVGTAAIISNRNPLVHLSGSWYIGISGRLSRSIKRVSYYYSGSLTLDLAAAMEKRQNKIIFIPTKKAFLYDSALHHRRSHRALSGGGCIRGNGMEL